MAFHSFRYCAPRLPPSQQARHHDREATAEAQLAKLKPTVPTLALILSADAPPGTTVARNGVLLQAAALGIALPVDPGEYVIVTNAPGAEEHSVSVSIALGEAKRVPLEVGLSPSAPKAPSDDGATPNPSVNTPSDEPSSKHPSYAPAYVTGAIGITGIGVGAVTGILVFGKKTIVKNECVGTTCTQAGLDAASSAKQLATVSNVAFAVGIVGLASSAILLLTRSKSEPASAASRANWQPLVASAPGGAWAGLERHW
jgi:hypothetical protein